MKKKNIQNILLKLLKTTEKFKIGKIFGGRGGNKG